MAIRMMSGLPARVIQVLQDYLPAELDLIDAEEADGVTTPDIASADYYPWDIHNITAYPACSIRAESTVPIEVLDSDMGSRVDAYHNLEVMFHVTSGVTDSAGVDLQVLLARYISGAARVLCITKWALQTSADPTRFVEVVQWVNEATYGPQLEQDDGAIVRTAILPIRVRRRESR